MSPREAPAYARPVAIGIIRDGDEIFVFEGRDPETGASYCRPLGGTIELGERAIDAVKRELKEEAGAIVADAGLLTVLENIWTWQGQQAHEIVFVFEVTLADHDRLRAGPVEAYEANGERINCLWKPLEAFRNGAVLYPRGLLEAIDAVRGGSP